MEKRLREFDLIRALAALSVIAIHATSGYVRELLVAHTWNEMMRYAVPCFVLLSGLVLVYIDRNRQPMPYLTFLRKRFSKLLIPYVLWTVIYIFYLAREVWRTQGWTGVMRIIDTLPDHFLEGTGSYHLYFVLIMFQLYLIYPLLRMWLQKNAASLLIVTFAISATMQTVPMFIGHLYWPLHHFSYWIFYFVLGMYLALKNESVEQKVSGRSWLLGSLWLVSLIVLIQEGIARGTSYSSIKPTVILYAIISFFFFYAVALHLKNTTSRLGRFADWISTHSFLIYLLHPLVITFLWDQSKKYSVTAIWDGTIGMFAWFFVVTLVTFAITKVVSYTPIAPLLGGVYVKPTKQSVKKPDPA